MPRETWPDVVSRACFDTWLDEVDLPQREAEVDAFAERWGDFSSHAFQQALQEGNAIEQLFAIFALGYLAPPNMDSLFIPFLHSSERKHRWASLIVLTGQKYPYIFELLQDFLLESIDYHSIYDQERDQIVSNAIDKSKELGN